MTGSWVAIPSSWKLEDVQAALSVVVTVLSTLAIFTFVRTCWPRAARQVAHEKDVSLASLLSLNTLGEALDAAFLLGPKQLLICYKLILVQCTIVVLFSIAVLVSGPIAGYSTRRGTAVRSGVVPGFLASRQHNGIGYAVVEWNLTYARLDEAGYPLDQLIDYLPDNPVEWKFDASEWNSSWNMDCQKTPQTTIQLEAIGNCSNLRAEVPGLAQAFSYDQWESYSMSWEGFYDSQTSQRRAPLCDWHERGGLFGVRRHLHVSLDDGFCLPSSQHSSQHK